MPVPGGGFALSKRRSNGNGREDVRLPQTLSRDSNRFSQEGLLISETEYRRPTTASNTTPVPLRFTGEVHAGRW